MGLSIHYRGQIKDMSLVPKLIGELKEISSMLQWDNDVFDDEIAKGISLLPADSEPVIVAFTPDGKLCSPYLLYHNIQPAFWISVKTQFAGIEVHKAVIRLLKYVNTNYFSDFELHDEGGYWETDDEKVLEKQFKTYDLAMDMLSTALTGFKYEPHEPVERLALRLEEFLKKKLETRSADRREN